MGHFEPVMASLIFMVYNCLLKLLSDLIVGALKGSSHVFEVVKLSDSSLTPTPAKPMILEYFHARH